MRFAYMGNDKKQGGKQTSVVEKRRNDDALTERLFEALKNRNADETISLLAAGADPNARDNNSWTALMYAAKYCPDAVGPLLAAGADPNAKCGIYDSPPLLFATRNHPEAVGPLLAAGANPNARDNDGWTALMLAAWHCPDAVGPLLAAGADPNMVCNWGLTPGLTPLMLAAELQPEAVGPLLDAGANPNTKDKKGKTAGDKAVENNNLSAFAEWTERADEERVLLSLKKHAAAGLALLCVPFSLPEAVLRAASDAFLKNIPVAVRLFLADEDSFRLTDFERFLGVLSSLGNEHISLDAKETGTLANRISTFLSEKPECLDAATTVMEDVFLRNFEEHASDPEVAPSIAALAAVIASLSSGECELDGACPVCPIL